MQPEQTQVPGTRHGPPAVRLYLIPQSDVEGDVAGTGWEHDRSDSSVIRFEGDDEHGKGETVDLEAGGIGPHRNEGADHVGERGRTARAREERVRVDVNGRTDPVPVG